MSIYYLLATWIAPWYVQSLMLKVSATVISFKLILSCITLISTPSSLNCCFHCNRLSIHQTHWRFLLFPLNRKCKPWCGLFPSVPPCYKDSYEVSQPVGLFYNGLGCQYQLYYDRVHDLCKRLNLCWLNMSFVFCHVVVCFLCLNCCTGIDWVC